MFQFSEEYMHHWAKLFHWITNHVLVDIMRNITRMMKIKNKNVESDIYREKTKQNQNPVVYIGPLFKPNQQLV